MPTNSLAARCFAEVIGTFLLVFFGCGAVHVAVLTGSLVGLWQVAIVWGVAIMLAIYVVGGISGAHINPAVTIALATWGRFRWPDVLPYILAQLVGAFVAAAILFTLYGPLLAEKEKEKHVVRGERGSEITAMCYGEYFPNPVRLSSATYSSLEHDKLNDLVTEPIAFLAEVLGTMILALAVFALTDERNSAAPAGRMAPVQGLVQGHHLPGFHGVRPVNQKQAEVVVGMRTGNFEVTGFGNRTANFIEFFLGHGSGKAARVPIRHLCHVRPRHCRHVHAHGNLPLNGLPATDKAMVIRLGRRQVPGYQHRRPGQGKKTDDRADHNHGKGLRLHGSPPRIERTIKKGIQLTILCNQA